MILLSLFFACSSSPEGSVPEEAPANAPKLEITPSAEPDLRGAPQQPAEGEPPFGITQGECESVPKNGEVAGPDCITGTISCGETVVGHTVGGTNHFTTQFYEKHHCTPATTDHDSGDERVYQLDVPDGDWTAHVYLDTPCGDLDLAAFLWSGDTCPADTSMIPRCEMSVRDGGTREHVRLVSRKATTWLLAVEGKANDEGAFALVVDCKEGL